MIQRFTSALKDCYTNPISFWVTIGTMCRYLEPYYYFPSFFMLAYPQFTSKFAIYNGLIYLFGGLFSTIVGGILSDKYSKKHVKAGSWSIILGSLFGLPLSVLSMLITNNFYLSIGLFAGKVLFSENWYSPSITMIQNTVPSK